MLLFRLEFQLLLASLKLTEVPAFDKVRFWELNLVKIFSHAFAFFPQGFLLIASAFHFWKVSTNSANRSFSCSLTFVVRLVLEAMLQRDDHCLENYTSVK